VIRAWEKYFSDEAEGRATAYEQSLAWNKANPGKQKCFSYGPLTSPDGGTTSGGVCANAVSAADATTDTPISEGTPTTTLNPSEPGPTQTDTVVRTENQTSDSLAEDSAAGEPVLQSLQLIQDQGAFPAVAVRFLANLPRG
jgi:hypothetical protein